MKAYQILYGSYERFKSLETNDFEQALRIAKKAIAFANRHKLTWTVSVWSNQSNRKWLIETTTTHPTTA